jgi:hypothetical protein
LEAKDIEDERFDVNKVKQENQFMKERAEQFKSEYKSLKMVEFERIKEVKSG